MDHIPEKAKATEQTYTVKSVTMMDSEEKLGRKPLKRSRIENSSPIVITPVDLSKTDVSSSLDLSVNASQDENSTIITAGILTPSAEINRDTRSTPASTTLKENNCRLLTRDHPYHTPDGGSASYATVTKEGVLMTFAGSRCSKYAPRRKLVTESSRQLRRQITNDQERLRVRKLNDAMDILREHLPPSHNPRQLSKIRTLRLAASYIGALTDMLAQNPVSENQCPLPENPAYLGATPTAPHVAWQTRQQAPLANYSTAVHAKDYAIPYIHANSQTPALAPYSPSALHQIQPQTTSSETQHSMPSHALCPQENTNMRYVSYGRPCFPYYPVYPYYPCVQAFPRYSDSQPQGAHEAHE